MIFRRCFVLLTLVDAISSFEPSFAPSFMTKRRSDRADGGLKQRCAALPLSMTFSRDETEAINNSTGQKIPISRTTKKEPLSKTIFEDRPSSVLSVDDSILATSVLIGSLLLAYPNPSFAMTTDIPQQPTSVAEPTTTRTTMTTRTTVPTSAMHRSFFMISEYPNPNELQGQQNYLDLAGGLKEELKFRANQAKEKGAERAREARERKQAEAEKRAAKLKEYDDMFDQAEKERNEYYSKRIISRDTYLQNLKDQETTVFNPDASPVEDLKEKLEQNLEEENRLRIALKENSQKDSDDRETKVERTLLKISIEKAELETSKLRKDLALEESIETIRLQRQAEVKMYQERTEIREREKQEQIEKIRLIKEREREEFLELRARKKQEVEDLKFASSQAVFDRKFDDLDRFEERKGILSSKPKEKDVVRLQDPTNDVNPMAVEGARTEAK